MFSNKNETTTNKKGSAKSTKQLIRNLGGLDGDTLIHNLGGLEGFTLTRNLGGLEVWRGSLLSASDGSSYRQNAGNYFGVKSTRVRNRLAIEIKSLNVKL